MDYAIETNALTKRFRKLVAVNEIELRVPYGSVYGFLGRNGAGKTTTILMLLGLLRPTSGGSTVLGYSTKIDSVSIRAEVGYVPEKQIMYDWMTVKEILWFTGKFYKTWNEELANDLVQRFGLDPKRRIKHLSRGMVAELSLILALAPAPKLLILDDPTSGMDPIVRREFMEHVVDLVQDGKHTVFFSSHILSDIERVADWVGILKDGRLLIQSEVDALKLRTRKVIAKFAAEPPRELAMGEPLWVRRDGTALTATFSQYDDGIPEKLKSLGATTVQVLDLSLDDIFVEYLGPEKE
ncbi:MAG: ABC transporter ATP-binding protein [Candidatus Abyssobacteria bacterium SURF_17]|uniref:ABC transporter ATP-binding protein n=1 Tax=Candidatus Abyssobacteria bacterium SURF_17 TaxID=2093361 RepID=A0A419EW07_9BACT|nr:MAG: ABC transporter ATP-binding protein [Candidatus Abyssubacteria bacterium SURF_17]